MCAGPVVVGEVDLSLLRQQVRYHQSRSITRWPVRVHNRIPVKVVSINLINGSGKVSGRVYLEVRLCLDWVCRRDIAELDDEIGGVHIGRREVEG